MARLILTIDYDPAAVMAALDGDMPLSAAGVGLWSWIVNEMDAARIPTTVTITEDNQP
jgi:hypothetical protein